MPDQGVGGWRKPLAGSAQLAAQDSGTDFHLGVESSGKLGPGSGDLRDSSAVPRVVSTIPRGPKVWGMGP